MTEDELIRELDSGDYFKVTQALVYVEKQLTDRPSPRLVNKLLDLCLDKDADIRNEAVQAAGFYWQFVEAFPILVNILSHNDEDELVLYSAVCAISELARNNHSIREKGLKLLATVSANEQMLTSIREAAYVLALKVDGVISTDMYARMIGANNVSIDFNYISSLILRERETGTSLETETSSNPT